MGYSIFDETMVDMPWPEIEKAIKQKAIVLLPIGVVEEHGPHMGLAVDIYASYAVSKLVKKELENQGTRTLIAPPYYWGINTINGCFPGSFSVRPDTMKSALCDILTSLKNWGVTQVFIINWHAEFSHNIAIFEGIKEARLATGIQAYCVINEFEARGFKLTGKEDYLVTLKAPSPMQLSSKYLDLHAGSLETGMMLSYFPEQVNIEIAKSLEPTRFTAEDLKAVRHGGSEVRKAIPSGYFGDPAGFDIKAGKQIIESTALHIANAIDGVLRGS